MSRSDLWPTPIWEIDLRDRLGDLGALTGRALDHLRKHPLPEHPLQQSDPSLASSGLEWSAAGRVIEEVARAVARRELRMTDGQNLVLSRCWVVRCDGSADFDRTLGTADLLHSHLPSTLSSVLYLQLPAEFEGTESVGTTLRSPNAAVARQLREPTNSTRPGRTGHLLLFPSWLEHAPAQAPPGCIYTRPRVVVASDFTLIG